MSAVTMIFMNRYDGLFARYERKDRFDITDWLAALWALVRAETKRRRDAKHLHDLPAYLLEDIGLERTDIETAVRGE